MKHLKFSLTLAAFSITITPAQAARICDGQCAQIVASAKCKHLTSNMENLSCIMENGAARDDTPEICAQAKAVSGCVMKADAGKGNPAPVRRDAQSAERTPGNTTANNRKEKRHHVPDAVATKCLSLDNKHGLYGGFVNSCDYAVERTYCAYLPKKGAWVEAFDCEKGQFGSDLIGAKQTSGAHVRGAEKIHWVACRYRGPDGKPLGVSPMDIKWDHQKKSLTFRCGEWGSGRAGK